MDKTIIRFAGTLFPLIYLPMCATIIYKSNLADNYFHFLFVILATISATILSFGTMLTIDFTLQKIRESITKEKIKNNILSFASVILAMMTTIFIALTIVFSHMTPILR